MAENHIEDGFLEAYFAAARRGSGDLPAALAARMLADAAEVQAARVAAASAGRAGSGAGLVQQFLRVLGGWPTMGGLAAACATGVWLGVAPPDFLPDPVGLMVQQSSDVNLLDSYALSSVLAEDG
jgi:hypothetical protein